MLPQHYVYIAVIAILFGVSLFASLRAFKSGDSVDGVLAGLSLSAAMFMLLLRSPF